MFLDITLLTAGQVDSYTETQFRDSPIDAWIDFPDPDYIPVIQLHLLEEFRSLTVLSTK